MQTPQTLHTALAKTLGMTAPLYLKREDLHPLSSHKGRSIPTMMQMYAKDGVKHFVISSSGNAAIAAASALSPDSTLTMFVGEKIDPKKIQLLKASNKQKAIQIEQVDNPKQRAFLLEKTGKAKNLRQSTDDTALLGYATLAEELNEIPDLHAIFIPTSSGTTAQALGAWFLGHRPSVQIHIVQTEAVHPIAEHFDKNFNTQGSSNAGAIVDRIAHRKNMVIDILQKTGGSGWIASDPDIQTSIKLVKEKTGIVLSPNGALGIAGITKAIKKGWQPSGAVVCLITGQ